MKVCISNNKNYVKWSIHLFFLFSPTLPSTSTSLQAWEFYFLIYCFKIMSLTFFCNRVNLKSILLFFLIPKYINNEEKKLSTRLTFGIRSFALILPIFFQQSIKVAACVEVLSLGRWFFVGLFLSREVPKSHNYGSTALRGNYQTLKFKPLIYINPLPGKLWWEAKERLHASTWRDMKDPGRLLQCQSCKAHIRQNTCEQHLAERKHHRVSSFDIHSQLYLWGEIIRVIMVCQSTRPLSHIGYSLSQVDTHIGLRCYPYYSQCRLNG